MANVGTIAPNHGNGSLEGTIRTLTIGGRVRLVPTGVAPDTRDPTHTVYMRTPDGSAAEVGAAWSKTIKRGANAGQELLSITIDDPSLPQPLHLSGFPASGVSGGYDLVWRRQRGSAPAAAAGQGQPPANDHDSIPF